MRGLQWSWVAEKRSCFYSASFTAGHETESVEQILDLGQKSDPERVGLSGKKQSNVMTVLGRHA